MARPKGTKNTTISQRAKLCADWRRCAGTVSRRAFATANGVSESNLRAWLASDEALGAVAHAHPTDIYIRKTESPAVELIKSAMHENGQPPTIDDALRAVAATQPATLDNKNYDSRRRIAERLLARAGREELGFRVVKTNVGQTPPNPDIKMTKCGCKSKCGGSCKNRRVQVECVDATCNVGRQCGNRRIQDGERGVKPTLVKKPVEGKGNGMFATTCIPKGAFIAEYAGELIDAEEYAARARAQRGIYVMELVDDTVYIDAMHTGTHARVFNHACRPNSKAFLWHVGDIPRVGIFALRKIKPGEEVTFHYGDDYQFPDRCGCDTCKSKSTML